MFLVNNLIFWSSKHQNVVSRSSTEVKHQVVTNGVAEACWLRQVLQELHTPLMKSTLIYYDNINDIYLFTNPIQH
jgi:glucan phosphorylase